MSNWLDEATERFKETQEDSGDDAETLNVFADSEIVSEADEDLPEWFGVRWREIELHHQREAWIGLRRWVDWFTDTFRLHSQTVPACWFQHPGIVEELYAAMCLEHQVWASKEPGVAAITMWHQYMPGILARLREATSNTGCSETEGHVAEKSLVRAVDEEQWAAVLGTRKLRKTVDHPEEGQRGVRAVVIDHDGQEVITTRPAGLSAKSITETPSAVLHWGAATGWDDEDVELVLSHAHSVAAVRWESSDDGGKSWETFDTTESE